MEAQYDDEGDFVDQTATQSGSMAATEQILRRFQKLMESTFEIVEVSDGDRVICRADPALEPCLGNEPVEIAIAKPTSPTNHERLECVLRALLEGRLERASVLVKPRRISRSVDLLDATITTCINGLLGPELIISARSPDKSKEDPRPDLL